jgi:hypothetical protein
VSGTLRAVQQGLEQLYRIDTGVTVDDFVVGHDVRAALAPGRQPREQLLVSEAGGEMELALFLDPSAIANLAQRDPRHRLDEHNVGDFLLALEGVSHFVYTVMCAQQHRTVSALELELQAEVDKYLTCLLLSEGDGDPTSRSEYWRQRLFVSCEYDDDLDADEHDRYRAANDNALRYTGMLQDRFVTTRQIPAMLAEARRFYRRGLAAKLASAAGR